MRKGHYRYIRKSSLGTYNFDRTNSLSSEINKSNAQYKIMVSVANQTPETLLRRKAVALIDEIEKIRNIDWKYYGKPSTYDRDRICYKINTGVYDELLSNKKIFDDWEKLIYTLYKPEESQIVSSTETWDATANIINEIKRKGNFTNPKEIESMMNRVNDKVEYYKEKYNHEKLMFKLFILALITLFVLFAVITIFIE